MDTLYGVKSLASLLRVVFAAGFSFSHRFAGGMLFRSLDFEWDQSLPVIVVEQADCEWPLERNDGYT